MNTKEIKENVDAEIKKIISFFDLSEANTAILESVFSGKFIKDSAEGKSRQWAQSFFNTIALRVWAEASFTREILLPYIDKAREQKILLSSLAL